MMNFLLLNNLEKRNLLRSGRAIAANMGMNPRSSLTTENTRASERNWNRKTRSISYSIFSYALKTALYNIAAERASWEIDVIRMAIFKSLPRFITAKKTKITSITRKESIHLVTRAVPRVVSACSLSLAIFLIATLPVPK